MSRFVSVFRRQGFRIRPDQEDFAYALEGGGRFGTYVGIGLFLTAFDFGDGRDRITGRKTSAETRAQGDSPYQDYCSSSGLKSALGGDSELMPSLNDSAGV